MYIRRAVPESPDWAHRAAAGPRPSIWTVLSENVGLTIYVVVMPMA